MANKATAFTVSARPEPKAAAAGAGGKGGHGKREPFKFLRKMEGHRATPGDVRADDDQATPRRLVPTAHSEFLQAVHADRGREKDPFADALVAVPKRPPPKQSSSAQPAATESNHRLSPPSNTDGRPSRVNTAGLDDDYDDEDNQHDQPPPKVLQTTSRPNPQRDDEVVRRAPPEGNNSRSSSRAADDHTTTTQPAAVVTRPRSRNEMLGLTERPQRQPQPEVDNGYEDEVTTHHRPQRVAPQSYTTRQPEPAQQRYRSADSRPAKYADPLDHDDVAEDGVDEPYDNYFPAQRRGGDRPQYQQQQQPPRRTTPATRAAAEPDEEIMAELERQLEEVRAEKNKYQRLVSEANKRREQDRKLYESTQSELQAEREEFEAMMAEEKKNLRREKKQLEEQRKRQAEAAGSEREVNRRMQLELETARDTLDKLSSEMRDKDRTHKAEVDRLRRQIADLQARNDELSEMVRAIQADEAEAAAEQSRHDKMSQQRNRAQQQQQQQPQVTLARAPAHQAPRTTATHGRHDEISEEDDDVQSHESDSAAYDKRTFLRGAAVQNDRYADESRLGINHSTDAAQRQQAAVAGGGRARQEQAAERNVATQRAASAGVGRRQSPPQDEDFNYAGPNKPRVGAQPARSPQRQQEFVIPSLAQFVADVVEPNPVEDIPGDSVTARNVGTDGKTEQLFRSGKRVITYSNGTRKIVLQSGHVILHFSNGDVKRTFPTGKTTYWYAVPQTTHTQMPDGLQVFQFHNTNQTEKHYPDGSKEILYPEGVLKKIAPDCSEVTYFPDGSIRRAGAAA